MRATILSVLLLVCILAPARAAERRIAIEPGARQVKRYEKIEFTLGVSPQGENPYDPNEIALDLVLTTPAGGTITLPAFHYQPFERQRVEQGRRRSEWLYPVGAPVWKARFAPGEVGMYSCEATLTDRAGTVRSDRVTFESLPSEHKGYVRVSGKDSRFFAFDDDSPFFPVGQNVAFVRDVYELDETFRKMAAQGANYARVWTCCEDWAMAIEARKSLWGRSWAWHPPIVAMPDREGYHSEEKCVRIAGEKDTSVDASPSRPLALRPSTKYELSGMVRTEGDAGLSVEISGVAADKELAGGRKWTRFKHEFASAPGQWWLSRIAFRLTGKGSAWLRELSLREAGGGPELLWEADVNRPVRGHYNPVDCFMLDQVVEAGESHGIHLQLVLLTRDHYMDLLKTENSRDYDEALAGARRLLRYAVARWGYSTAVAAWEYFNELNPGLPTDRFYAGVGEYLEQIDPYRHLRATSAWGPSKKDWRHAKLDIADMHYYLRPTTGQLYRDAVESVLQRAKLLRENSPDKPALLSEFGMTKDNWQRTPDADADREYVHLHNALWASAMSGLSGAVLSWFWEDIEKKDMYHHYRPLAAFLADVPFPTAGFRRATATSSDEAVRVIGLQGKTAACLWLSNRQATWWNIGVEKAEPKAIAGASLTIDGLEPGTYKVQWWDTWDGKTRRQDEVRATTTKLELNIPAFSRDVACKVLR